MPKIPLAFKLILPIVALVRLASITQLVRQADAETLIQSYGPVGLGLLTYLILSYLSLALSSLIPPLRGKYTLPAAGLALLAETLLLGYTLATPHLEATRGYLAYAAFNITILALALVAAYTYPEEPLEGGESGSHVLPDAEIVQDES